MNETVDPAQAIRLAINMNPGKQNQLQISNSLCNLQLNALVPERQFRNLNQRQTTQVQINCVEFVISLGQPIIGKNVSQKLKPAIIVASRISLLVCVKKQNPLLQKLPAQT